MIIPTALEKYLNYRRFVIHDIYYHKKKQRYVLRVSNVLSQPPPLHIKVAK